MKGINKFLRYITIIYAIITACVYILYGVMGIRGDKITLGEILRILFSDAGICIILWIVIVYFFIRTKSFNKKKSLKIVILTIIFLIYTWFIGGNIYSILSLMKSKRDLYIFLTDIWAIYFIYPQLLVLLSIFCSYLVARKKDIKRDKTIE